MRKTISKEFCKHFLIHPSILNVCYHPTDLARIEDLILKGEGSTITQEEENLFFDWIYLLEFRMIKHNTIFNR